MPLKITTWNINSVRLRIDLVAKFLKAVRPDVLCLQETKCPDEAFPLKRFKRLGYEHAALYGQKGYHGVAVLSRLPFEASDMQNFCGKTDCRHVSVVLGERANLRDPITLHNFYVPAGGDEPDPELNAKFAHKLSFLDEMRAHPGFASGAPRSAPSWSAISTWRRSSTTSGTTNKCSKSSRTRRSNARSSTSRAPPAIGSTACACSPPSRRSSTLGGATARWTTGRAADRGRRLDHVWSSDALAGRVSKIEIAKNYRGAARPSDHVPVTATIEV